MDRKWLLQALVIILLIVGIILATIQCTPKLEVRSEKPLIATTFYPLFDFTRTIAGNAADVFSIVPINSEPHEYQETPHDLIRLEQADVFVVLGVNKGFAPFEEHLMESVSNVTVIVAGNGIYQITPTGEFGDVSDDLNYNGLDPHIWVSPKNAIVMVQNIRDGLMSVDPANVQTYEQNANALLANLQELDVNYTKTLSNCSVHVILAAHDAFSYLARDYGFKSYYVDGLSPEQEPTPQQIARLVDLAKQYNLKYLFYEQNVDPRVSNTIAEQVGATTLPLNPAEAVDNVNVTYVQIMQENLVNLGKGMGCG